MAVKLIFVLLAALLLTQLCSAIPVPNPQEHLTNVGGGGGDQGTFGKEIEKTIDGTLSNWKDGIDNFFKKGIQADRMFQDLTGNIQTFSTNVAGAGKSFVQHLQGKTDTMIDKLKTQ